MSARTQHEDPAWVPGKRNPQRSSGPGRTPVPSPTAEELHDMSATEKVKVARRIRNREGAQRSKDQKLLQTQVTQLQGENTRLRNQLSRSTAELDRIKREFEEYKAQQQQNISPFSSSSYYLRGASPDLNPPFLHPDDPMNNNNNGKKKSSSTITNPSTPNAEAANVHLINEGIPQPAPHLSSAATAPTALEEPDLHSVMQWKYPDYYDSSMQFHSHDCYTTHHSHGVEIEETPLVFTPFAAVTSPREALLSSESGGNGHMRVTEFSAWRPRDPGLAGGDQQQYARENSNTAQNLARMMSSPAAFNGSGPLFASE